MRNRIQRIEPASAKQYYKIDDLSKHRYFRHVVDILKTHPHKDSLISTHAAVLVKGSSIIATGFNKPFRNGFVRVYAKHNLHGVHAECDVILQGRRKHDLNGSHLYVARVLKNGITIAYSRPCPTCQEMAWNYGIKDITFSTYEGDLEYMKVINKFEKVPFFIPESLMA